MSVPVAGSVWQGMFIMSAWGMVEISVVQEEDVVVSVLVEVVESARLKTGRTAWTLSRRSSVWCMSV